MKISEIYTGSSLAAVVFLLKALLDKLNLSL